MRILCKVLKKNACFEMFFNEIQYNIMGFYTTWRLLSWNRYLIVLGLVTKRPKTSNEETKG